MRIVVTGGSGDLGSRVMAQGAALGHAMVSASPATQFHTLAAYFARMLTKGPFTFPIGRMAFQPVDTDWVAGRLLDLATGPRPTAYRRATDVAGPDVLALEEIARSCVAAAEVRPAGRAGSRGRGHDAGLRRAPHRRRPRGLPHGRATVRRLAGRPARAAHRPLRAEGRDLRPLPGTSG